MAKKSTLRGKVVSHNISPKGEIEGAVIKTATGTAQVNFPKHGEASLAIDDDIDVAVELEHDDGDHEVYLLAAANGESGGTVTRFNYARHGEVNGYHLDDGTFVHVKPDGARKYKIKVGDRITAAGDRRPGRDAVVIEAKSVKKLAKR